MSGIGDFVFGSDDPAAPAPVQIDPRETAEAQYKFGKKAALYNKQLAESTFQETPYGSVSYENVYPSQAEFGRGLTGGPAALAGRIMDSDSGAGAGFMMGGPAGASLGSSLGGMFGSGGGGVSTFGGALPGAASGGGWSFG